jgi:hypothetical protein
MSMRSLIVAAFAASMLALTGPLALAEEPSMPHKAAYHPEHQAHHPHYARHPHGRLRHHHRGPIERTPH